MKITIDTKEDTREELQHVIHLLQDIVGVNGQSGASGASYSSAQPSQSPAAASPVVPASSSSGAQPEQFNFSGFFDEPEPAPVTAESLFKEDAAVDTAAASPKDIAPIRSEVGIGTKAANMLASLMKPAPNTQKPPKPKVEFY